MFTSRDPLFRSKTHTMSPYVQDNAEIAIL